MHIEFIGCTGAGKSRLTNSVIQQCHAQRIDAWKHYDFVLKQVWLNWLQNEFCRNVVVNLISAFAGLIAWRRYCAFYRFAAQIIARLPVTVPWSERLRIGRNVLKNIGIYELVRSRAQARQLVLVDEGTLHTAHYLFVHLACEPDGRELSDFMKLVPIPDVVVHVVQNKEVLIERTLKRGHKRIKDNSRAAVGCFIERAVAVFDHLVTDPALEDRLLVADARADVIVSPEYPQTPSFEAIRKLVLAPGRVDGMTQPRAGHSVAPACFVKRQSDQRGNGPD